MRKGSGEKKVTSGETAGYKGQGSVGWQVNVRSSGAAAELTMRKADELYGAQGRLGHAFPTVSRPETVGMENWGQRGF